MFLELILCYRFSNSLDLCCLLLSLKITMNIKGYCSNREYFEILQCISTYFIYFYFKHVLIKQFQ